MAVKANKIQSTQVQQAECGEVLSVSAKGCCNCLQLFEAYGCRGEKVLLQISQAVVRRNEEMK